MMSWVRQNRERQQSHQAPSKSRGFINRTKAEASRLRKPRDWAGTVMAINLMARENPPQSCPHLGGEEEDPTWPHHASPAAGGQDTTP